MLLEESFPLAVAPIGHPQLGENQIVRNRKRADCEVVRL